MPFSGDPWTLVAEGDALESLQLPAVFTLGNGFVGLRGPGDAAGAARVYLNGVFEKLPISYHESAFGFARESDRRPGVADATRIAIRAGGTLAKAPLRVALDMRRGVLVEDHVVAGVAIRTERLVSMVRPGLVATRIRFGADGPRCVVSVAPFVESPPTGSGPESPDGFHDPRLGPDTAAGLWSEICIIATDSAVGRVDVLRRSGFAVAALASAPHSPARLEDADLVFDCFASYAALRGGGDALGLASEGLAAAHSVGFEALAAEQAQWFEAYWHDCDVRFPESPVAEQVQRHALFQLAQAAGADGRRSVAAKGQSGEGYEGHIFWDADLYVLPVFAQTRPEIARGMLHWRIAGLDAARRNAEDLGHRQGALYPWRTIEGRECSSYFPAGSAQYHINADIAHALRAYLAATGDHEILSQGGARMVVETARLWMDTGYHDPARGEAFVINRVTGPDEYSALVDNNLYTNLMAAEHLRLAVSVGAETGLLDPGEAERMTRAADAMFLPFDAERGIYAQDDAFFGKAPWPFEASRYPLLLHYHPLAIYRHRVAKQADAVLALALLPERFAPAMQEKMLAAYEAVTVHDSTLSASAFATVAARVGSVDKAFHYWQVAALTDLSNLFGNSHHGLHMAALAGSWTALTAGFAGMRTAGDRLAFAPVAVPQLGRYAFRIRHRGRRIEVDVARRFVTYRLLDGDALTLWHGDEALLLRAGDAVIRELYA